MLGVSTLNKQTNFDEPNALFLKGLSFDAAWKVFLSAGGYRVAEEPLAKDLVRRLGGTPGHRIVGRAL